MIFTKTEPFFFKGEKYVDLRTDEIDLIKQKRGVTRVILGDEFMDIPYSKIRWGKKITTKVFDMKYPPYGTFQLISFRWIPSGKVPDYKVEREISLIVK